MTAPGRWHPVSPRHRCQVCGRSSWCAVTGDGQAWICRRQPGPDAQERLDRHGCPYWLHGRPTVRLRAIDRPGPGPAPPEVLNEVYCDLLAGLELADDHRDTLEARGLPDYAIRRCRTWDPARLPALARRAGARHPEHAASVPGLRLYGGRPAWARMARGIAMPRWDLAGRVVALQLRPDRPSQGGKYRYLSSGPTGGPGPVMVASPALPPALRGRQPGSLRAREVRLTEGWLGAWVAAELTGTLTLDVSGVSLWRLSLPVLRHLRAREVLLAWDADWRRNEHVRATLRQAATELRHAGYGVMIETWDPALGRGLDDVLLELRRRGVA